MYEYSVVLPSHSEGKYLKRTVESVLETAGDTPVEVVVVDDRSDDFSGDEVAAAYEGDDRVQVIQSLYSLGAGGARSLGADAAAGRTLVFMDSHSQMPRSWPDSLRRAQKQVRGATFFGTALRPLGPDIDAGVVAPLDAHGTWLADPDMQETYPEPRDNTESPYPVMSLPGGCMVVGRDLYDELGGFDLGLRPPWGQECLEICLRTWALGYEVRVIPALAIKTLYKSEAQADKRVRYSSMLYNRLRIAHLYFSRDRIERVIEAMKEDDWFHVAMAEYLCNGAVTMWQRAIAPRRHPEDIFERFGIDW